MKKRIFLFFLLIFLINGISGFLNRAFAEEIAHIGNLTIVSFDPTKEENIVRERTEWAVRKLVELTSKKVAGEIITRLAGNIASKSLGFVSSVISQMPTVGMPTEIDCYFIVGDEVTKRAEMYSKDPSPIPYYPVGILVYVFQGDELVDINIEISLKLRMLSKTIFKETIFSSFSDKYLGHVLLITNSQPIMLKESGEYVLRVNNKEALVKIKEILKRTKVASPEKINNDYTKSDVYNFFEKREESIMSGNFEAYLNSFSLGALGKIGEAKLKKQFYSGRNAMLKLNPYALKSFFPRREIEDIKQEGNNLIVELFQYEHGNEFTYKVKYKWYFIIENGEIKDTTKSDILSCEKLKK